MSEISKFEAYKKKMQGLCDEHDLTFRFRNKEYPITLTIRPVSGVTEQLSMLAQEEDNYISPDASIVFSFAEGVITYKMADRFTISDALFQKIKNLYKNMTNCWLQYFFRNIIERGVLPKGAMPVIDEAEADGETEDEPPAEYADEDETDFDIADGEDEDSTELLSLDEYLISEAIKIVRAENKASTALIQRRLNIGFAKAAQLMTELEIRGVVGSYADGQPREVLPNDVPDDE